MTTPVINQHWSYEPVPKSAIRLFRMAWQLEAWLRVIVYVELRAARKDWEEPIKKRVRGWPPDSLTKDKRLHHMVTPHQAALSYLTFGELWDVIAQESNWPLYEPYFPPRHNTDVRVEEVKAIRNRVAHFREPHPQDEMRLELFLRDMEPGLRRFCSRYTAARSVTDDPVAKHLEDVWERVGYGVELMRPDPGWLYAPQPRRMRPLVNARLDVLVHANCTPAPPAGVIYRLTVRNNEHPIDAVSFVENTKRLHKDLVHILLSSNEIAITIPAITGVEATATLVADFLHAAVNSEPSNGGRAIERRRTEWPEYILLPDHLLTFFDDSMPDAILDLAAETARQDPS